MKLWGGRFTKETNQLVHNFNASISFDQKFYKQDIEGSIAHATMLGKQGIIPESESEQIVKGLKGILADIENGKLEITDEYENIQRFIKFTQKELNSFRIEELKQKLNETDYCVLKIAEGSATHDDYSEIIAKRREWRKEINNLEESTND